MNFGREKTVLHLLRSNRRTDAHFFFCRPGRYYTPTSEQRWNRAMSFGQSINGRDPCSHPDW